MRGLKCARRPQFAQARSRLLSLFPPAGPRTVGRPRRRHRARRLTGGEKSAVILRVARGQELPARAAQNSVAARTASSLLRAALRAARACDGQMPRRGHWVRAPRPRRRATLRPHRRAWQTTTRRARVPAPRTPPVGRPCAPLAGACRHCAPPELEHSHCHLRRPFLCNKYPAEGP